jgi:hypothetical protein
LIGLSKIEGAVSCVSVITKGSLFADTNSAMAEALNSPSASQTVNTYTHRKEENADE